jgi:hypothetical protein
VKSPIYSGQSSIFIAALCIRSNSRQRINIGYSIKSAAVDAHKPAAKGETSQANRIDTTTSRFSAVSRPGLKISRTPFFTPLEQLKQAASINAELLRFSNSRNPYKSAPLGVIEEGAWDDMIIYNRNPLEDVMVALD